MDINLVAIMSSESTGSRALEDARVIGTYVATFELKLIQIFNESEFTCSF